jgi:hypothetical protein
MISLIVDVTEISSMHIETFDSVSVLAFKHIANSNIIITSVHKKQHCSFSVLYPAPTFHIDQAFITMDSIWIPYTFHMKYPHGFRMDSIWNMGSPSADSFQKRSKEQGLNPQPLACMTNKNIPLHHTDIYILKIYYYLLL